MTALMINPTLPTIPTLKNPRGRKRRGKGRRKKNPSATSYTKAAGEVFIPPLAFAGSGALVGLIVASVAKPQHIRYSAVVGALLGLGVMGVLATDSIAHG